MLGTLESELKKIVQAIEQARTAGDQSAIVILSDRKKRLCELLAALDPVM